MNIQALLKQATKMQATLAAAEKKLDERTYEVTAAEGKLVIQCKGDYTVTKVEISDELMSDKEMLQDLVTVSINAALAQAKGERAKVTSEITGGVKLPGAF